MKPVASLCVIALLLIAITATAQTVWDGTADSTWYTNNKSATTYTITTPKQLAGLAQLVNGRNSMSGKTIKLGADIMLNDTANWQNWATTPPRNTWAAIGTENSLFLGIFDGAGYVISGVYINDTTDNQGLFGYLGNDGVIKNVGVVAFYIKGGNYVGGLVGHNGSYLGYLGDWVGLNGGTVSNSYSSGTVSGNKNIGGLVGYNQAGTVINSYSTAAVNGSYDVGGLVGSNNGTVNNSYSTGAVSGSSSVGGLAGYNSSTVSNSYSTGKVNGTKDIGGLVGISYKGAVSNSYSTGTVSGTERVGGLIGFNSGSTVINGYSTGAVYGTGLGVGGLVGLNGGTVSNSYSIGNVSGTEDVGGLVGHNSCTVINSYYDKLSSGQSDEGKGEGKTTADMQGEEFVENLNFVAGVLSMNTWVYAEGQYPKLSNTKASAVNIASYFASGTGTEANPFIITTKEHLEYLSLFVNAGNNFSGEYFKLGNDITLNDTTGWQNWATMPPKYPWIAIGIFNSYPFSGTFDGNGYVISGIYINNENDFQGLFGFNGGTINNVGVVAFYIKGGNYVGGLVGMNFDGTVINSYSIGTVSGTGNSVGGLVGSNGVGTVSNSYSIGAVSGGAYVGGLVGINWEAEDCTVINSYSTGTVNGSNYVGGLVGFNECTVINSYSTGTVSGGDNVGGLVGYNYNMDGSGTVSNSYYYKETSKQNNTDKGTGKTTAEMKKQSTFVGWDFKNIWGISKKINNGYPHLINNQRR